MLAKLSLKGKEDGLDEYSYTYTIECGELEAYVEELLRSNFGSIVKVELCRYELRNGKKVFKRMYVFKSSIFLSINLFLICSCTLTNFLYSLIILGFTTFPSSLTYSHHS